MSIFSKVYILGLAIFLSCADRTIVSDTMQDPWPFGVSYEIFVQSFADSNGDGIGDIPGMTTKLDYLAELGIQAVWLMPISPSPSYHKYDVTDYYGIHPDYGTIEDFKRFIVEAHDRQIRVIIDLVVNHCSSEHPWFIEATKDTDSPYYDYFVWADPDSIRDHISKKEITLDSDNITQWHESEDNEDFYYGFFWGGMPDLNYDNPVVREEIIKIGTFWLEEIGVDGFRLDAARHIYPDDRPDDSHAWWVEFGKAMRLVKPDVYMVGEVWGDASEIGPYLEGLPSMFNFDLWRALNQTLATESNNNLIQNLNDSREAYITYNESFIDAIFLNNHDQNRLLSNIEGGPAKAKLAASILLTLPGMPYLYYGDEIGMLGEKPDPEIREPFLWDLQDKAPYQTSWIASKNSNDSTVTPLAVQMDDERSIYHWYKQVIELRNAEEVLQVGLLTPLDLPDALLGYIRTREDEELLIIHNLTAKKQTLEQLSVVQKNILLSSEGNEFNNQQIILTPYGSVVLIKTD